jgi:hypothetical protein
MTYKIKLPPIPSSMEEYDKMASEPSYICLSILGMVPNIPNFKFHHNSISVCWGDGILHQYYPNKEQQ